MPYHQSQIEDKRRSQFNRIIETLDAAKRYKHVSGYPEVTKEVYRSLAGYTVSEPVGVSKGEEEKYNYVKSVMFTACMDLIFHQAPMFFLDPRFSLAIEKTDMDLSVKASKLVMPYDSMLFIFHKDTGTFSNGRVLYVLVYHHYPGSSTMQVMQRTVDELGMKPAPHIRDSYHFFVSSHIMTEDHGPQFSQADRCLYTDEDEYTIDDLLKVDGGMNGENDDEVVATIRCCRIAVGALMAMTCRPDLLTKEVIHHWQHKDPRKRGNVAFWNPNIIGNGYQISGGHGHGTHASPRMHWRRGHFRNQACGVGRKDHRQVWLEPMLVAANQVSEKAS